MKIKHRKSFICGIKGLKLSKKEYKFIKKISHGASFYFKEIFKILLKPEISLIQLKIYLMIHFIRY